MITLIAAKLAAIELWKWIRVSANNFPEIITLPITVIGLCIYPILLEFSGINWIFNHFHDNPAEPNRSLQAFEIMLIAMIYVFLANAAAYAAIKYNRRDLWISYTEPIPKGKFNPNKELLITWACYFFGILAAIFLAHSLITH